MPSLRYSECSTATLQHAALRLKDRPACRALPAACCFVHAQANLADSALAQVSQALAPLPPHYRAFYAARGVSHLTRGLNLPHGTLDTWTLHEDSA